MRRCAKMRCQEPAIATVALRYGERVVVVAELLGEHDPNLLDLCELHADLLKPPIGWRKADERDGPVEAGGGGFAAVVEEAWLDRSS